MGPDILTPVNTIRTKRAGVIKMPGIIGVCLNHCAAPIQTDNYNVGVLRVNSTTGLERKVCDFHGGGDVGRLGFNSFLCD